MFERLREDKQREEGRRVNTATIISNDKKKKRNDMCCIILTITINVTVVKIKINHAAESEK